VEAVAAVDCGNDGEAGIQGRIQITHEEPDSRN